MTNTPKTLPKDSVGLVQSQSVQFDQTLTLDCGRTLPSFHISYETYGTLNEKHSNAILICHALSSDQHAAGYHSIDDRKPGWWETAIGPGKPIDTNKFYVVCPNNIGSCKGSSGPNTINPETHKIYGPDFPIVTVKDWVRSQVHLANHLGIDQWAAVIGGSLGGMQALQWSIDQPDRLRHAVIIAAAPKLSTQNIAFNEVARQAIMSDSDFHGGHYYDHETLPRGGLMLARMLGHITYLSDDAMRAKFGRELREGKLNFGFDVDFQIESYLRHQGKSFVDRFDANSYLLITKTLDYFDPASDYNNDLALAMRHAKAKFLVLSFTSDWRFSPARSEEIVHALLDEQKDVTYAEIESHQGHDAFLMSIPVYNEILTAYMQRVVDEVQS